MASNIWHEVLKQSKTSLSEKERSLYGNSRPEDIVQDFRDRQFDQNQTSKLEEFLEKIQPFVSAIEGLEAIASPSLGIISPAWVTLRALLLVGFKASSPICNPDTYP
jgi:hypothetical protein